MKHTPAPWKVSLGHGGELWFDLKESGEWTESDRQLAEAAPDLLAACVEAKRLLGTMSMVVHPSASTDQETALQAFGVLGDAIAKAEGGAK